MPVVTGTLKGFGLTVLPAGAEVVFVATRAAISGTGEVLSPEPVVAQVAGDGSWSAQLAATEGLPDDVFYEVVVRWFSQDADAWVRAVVPTPMRVTGAGGLVQGTIPDVPALFVVDTQAEADALTGSVAVGSLIVVKSASAWDVYKVEA